MGQNGYFWPIFVGFRLTKNIDILLQILAAVRISNVERSPSFFVISLVVKLSKLLAWLLPIILLNRQ